MSIEKWENGIIKRGKIDGMYYEGGTEKKPRFAVSWEDDDEKKNNLININDQVQQKNIRVYQKKKLLVKNIMMEIEMLFYSNLRHKLHLKTSNSMDDKLLYKPQDTIVLWCGNYYSFKKVGCGDLLRLQKSTYYGLIVTKVTFIEKQKIFGLPLTLKYKFVIYMF